MNKDVLNLLQQKAQERGDKPAYGQLSTNTAVNLIDGDSALIKDENGEVMHGRQVGFDTAETEKYQTGGTWKPGELEGEYQAKLIKDYADENGYNNVEWNRDKDGNIELDAHDRGLYDLVDDKGNRLSSVIQATGVADSTFFGGKRPEDNREQLLGAAYTGLNLDENQQRLQQNSQLLRGGVQAFKSANDLDLTKEVALNEAEYAAGKPYELHRNWRVQEQTGDGRTIDNEDDSFIDAKSHWKSALYGIKDGIANWTDLKGDAFNSIGQAFDVDWMKRTGDWYKEDAEEFSAEIAHSFSQLPEFDQPEFLDKDGNWKHKLYDNEGNFTFEGVKSFTKASSQFAIQSLPYMLQTIAATAAGTAVAGPAGGLAAGGSVSSLIYTGQTYGEQEEKNIPVAILSGVSQATLEQFGLHALGKINLFTNKGINAAAKALGKKQGVSAAAAKITLSNGLGKSASELFGSLGQFTKAAGVEAATEAGQEAIGILGAGGDLNTIESKNRILTGLIAGGTLGGTFNVAGQAKNAVVSGKERTTGDALGTGINLDDKTTEVDESGRVRSAVDLANEFKQDAPDGFTADDFEKTLTKRNLKEAASYYNPVGILKRYANSAFYNALAPVYGKSKVIREIGGILGVGDLHGGLNYQTAPQAYFAKIAGNEFLNEASYQKFAGVSTLTPAGKAEIKELGKTPQKVRQDVENVKSGKRISNNYTQAQQSFINNVAKQEMEAKRLTGHDTNLTSGVVDRTSLRKSEKKELLKQKLLKDPNMDLDASTVANIVEDVAQGRERPYTFGKKSKKDESDYQRQFEEVISVLKNNDNYTEFTIKNPFAAVEARAQQIAQNLATDTFIGKDGSIIASGLTKAAIQDGLSPEEVSRTLKEIKDVVDATEGKRQIKSFLYNTAIDVGSMLVRTTFLPMVVITSVLDLGLVVMKDVPLNLWFNKLTGEVNKFSNSANESVRQIDKLFEENVDKTSPFVRAVRAGFLTKDQSAASRNDHQLNSKFLDSINSGFFQAIGLEYWTNRMRGIRLGIGRDAIRYQVQSYISNQDATTDKGKKEYQRAEELLRRYGFDPEIIEELNLYDFETGNFKGTDTPFDKAESEVAIAALNNAVEDSIIHFTNTAVVQPTTANRALLHSNPWLKLFTTFTGFSTAFTAGGTMRHIMNNATRGTNAEKASTITLAMSLMGLALLSLMAKAAVIQGINEGVGDEDEKFNAFPGLHTDAAKFRRVMDATGAFSAYGPGGSLGRVGEIGARILDSNFDTNTQLYNFGEPEGAWDWITSESSILDYFTKLVDAGWSIAQDGLTDQNIKKVGSITPILGGTRSAGRNTLLNLLGED